MDYKNRIVGYEEALVEAIIANPKNWRKHPIYQERALTGVLETVGVVQNVIINRTTGNLVDGHLRVQIAKKNHQKTLPATIVELSVEEEDLILAILDPLASMADKDQDKLNALIKSIQTDNEDVEGALSRLLKENEEKTEEVLIKRSLQLKPPQEYIMIICPTMEEFEDLRQMLGLGVVRRGGYKPGSEFDDVGAERLILASDFKERINNLQNPPEKEG